MKYTNLFLISFHPNTHQNLKKVIKTLLLYNENLVFVLFNRIDPFPLKTKTPHLSSYLLKKFRYTFATKISQLLLDRIRSEGQFISPKSMFPFLVVGLSFYSVPVLVCQVSFFFWVYREFKLFVELDVVLFSLRVIS